MRQQLRKLAIRVRIDSCEHVFQVSVRIDVIGFADGNEAQKNGGSFSAAFAANEQKVLARKAYAFNIPFGKIIV